MAEEQEVKDYNLLNKGLKTEMSDEDIKKKSSLTLREKIEKYIIYTLFIIFMLISVYFLSKGMDWI